MKHKLLIASFLLTLPIASVYAADEISSTATRANQDRTPLPQILNQAQREAYRAIFTAIRAGQWVDAASKIDAQSDGPIKSVARAELYLAKGSPKIDLEPLLALIVQAPDMPQSQQLARLARTRGASSLPDIAVPQSLVWLGTKPIRARASTTRGDSVAAALSAKILPLIKNDDPASAEMLIDEAASTLTPEALTEWQQRVAWSYYITGNDTAARLLGIKAQHGVGEWAVHADWVVGLAAWRDGDFRAASAAFQSVAQRGEDSEMRAAGLYWTARADIANGEPQKVQARLRAAAQYDETFYGLLAAQTLGIEAKPNNISDNVADWQRFIGRDNIRAAIALSEIGEFKLANDMLRFQAQIGGRNDHPDLVTLAAKLNLPETQLWLAHNGLSGTRPDISARYPAPNWTPDGGWRVDKSLVYAHALQESNFRRDVISPAGAYGLMQVMPAAAAHMARDHGGDPSRTALTNPSTNMEFGQRYLEYLRDFQGTQGLLPKVIAAYNAGPAPIRDWNARNIDRGDPLLYIESLPYWETRGYVTIVLRNYWMYQRNAGEKSASLAAIAQGMWPRFPGLSGAGAVRMDAVNRAQSAD